MLPNKARFPNKLHDFLWRTFQLRKRISDNRFKLQSNQVFLSAVAVSYMDNEEFVRAIESAKIYDLGQPYFWGMPVHPADPPFLIYLYRYHEHTQELFKDIAPGLDFADSLELVTTSMHSGTHIDALCHMSRGGKLFGGVSASQLETHAGYKRMGVEEVPLII